MNPRVHSYDSDPFVRRLFRQPSGLRPGGVGGEHEALATYHTNSGEPPFAICRDGLLLAPQSNARFVPFVEIENAGYYGNGEMVQRLKTAKIRRTEFSESLSLRLRDGEVINLPVSDDFLTIAKIIHERAAVYRSQERRTIRG